MTAMQKNLILKIVTPEGERCSVTCDSVKFHICDGNSRQGGSYGVRPNHADAVFALKAGAISANLDGETVFSAQISDGFAEKRDCTLVVSADKVNL